MRAEHETMETISKLGSFRNNVYIKEERNLVRYKTIQM